MYYELLVTIYICNILKMVCFVLKQFFITTIILYCKEESLFIIEIHRNENKK